LKTGSAYGTREDRRFRYTGDVNLRAGTNTIALLSVAVGLPVSFVFYLYFLKFYCST
jgi:hypothetical protein